MIPKKLAIKDNLMASIFFKIDYSSHLYRLAKNKVLDEELIGSNHLTPQYRKATIP